MDLNIQNYLRISWQDVILVCISTLIIVSFAKHFFWDKILAFVKKRQALIQDNIDSSEMLKKEAEEIKDQYADKMKGAGAEAAAMLDSARDQAQLEKDQILASARSQAAHIEASAKEEIDLEKRRAYREMKDAITDVAMAAASQILQEELDTEKQKKLIDQYLEDTGENSHE